MIRTGAFLLALCFLATTSAQDRFALVIGNGAYTGAAVLKNPPQDAAAVAAALEKLDFKVTKKTDVGLASFEGAVKEFRRSLTKGSVALFFYAGHGVQVRGENFLLPIDADVTDEPQVRRKCLPVDELLAGLEDSSAAMKVVILDSCRDNPLTRGWTRSAVEGLAKIKNVPEGTIIAFSTAPGKTALDAALGNRGNSPYAAQLVAALAKRPADGLEITRVLRDASREVKRHTGQVPWLEHDATIEDFYLWKDVTTAAVSPTPMPIEPPPPTLASPAPSPAPKPRVTRSKPVQIADQPPALPRGWKRIDHPHDAGISSAENSLGMKFVVLPAGEYWMGSSDDDTQADADEMPQHRVRIGRSFHMGMHEVTLGQFLKFYHAAKHKTDAEKDKSGSGYDADSNTFKTKVEFVPWTTGFEQTMDHPAVNVSWNDARAFCKWLSEKEGLTYRLPTEAEWEYACRSGTMTKYPTGDNPEELAEFANVADAAAKAKFRTWSGAIAANDGFIFSAPVGSFRPNSLGLYDLLGNAAEWCEDGYEIAEYSRQSGLVTNPSGPSGEPTYRVLRGGGWNVKSLNARSAKRSRHAPNSCTHLTGFRIVLPRSP